LGIAVVEKSKGGIQMDLNLRHEPSPCPGDLFHALFRIIFVIVNGPKIEKAWQ
jgi:hypothetical protein